MSQTRSRTKKPTKKQSLRRTQVVRVDVSHPPPLRYSLEQRRTLRFVSSAGLANVAVTFRNLLDTILIATTALAPFDLYDLVKVNRVTLWAIAPVGGTSITSMISFQTATGDNELHTETTLGQAIPLRISAVPSKRSLASFFTGPVATTAFVIQSNAIGTVVDVDLTFRDLPGTAMAAANASVGATVGAVYYRGLDGLAFGLSTIPPVAGVAVI